MNGFLVFYMQIDIVIISLLISEKQVGWYGSADRLFTALLFLPTVYMMAVFPALSRLQASASDSIIKLARLSFNLLNLVAVPMGLGLFVIANQLVVLVLGAEFVNSGPVLMVFGIVLIFTYQNTIIGMTLIAADRQKPWTRIIIIASLLSVPLDLILIPWCQQVFENGAIGGAMAFVVTEALMLTAGIRLLPKGTLNQANLSYALRTVLAGLIMLASIWWLRDRFILIPIAVGSAVYLVCILSLRLLTPEMRNMISITIAVIKQRLGIEGIRPAVGNPTK
jgi:O-antigen/teichoic acid export membrane protein